MKTNKAKKMPFIHFYIAGIILILGVAFCLIYLVNFFCGDNLLLQFNLDVALIVAHLASTNGIIKLLDKRLKQYRESRDTNQSSQ